MCCHILEISALSKGVLQLAGERMGHKVSVYPHNDLLNLAHYQIEKINKKVEKGDQDGISLDCMSAIIAMAFSVEAVINLVGRKRVKGWRERNPYHRKAKEVCAVAGHSFNKSVEPYKTLWKLKELRDVMAHGKPIEFSASIRTREDLRKSMECEWDAYSIPEYANHAWRKVKEFEHMLFKGAKLSVGQVLTGAIGLPQ